MTSGTANAALQSGDVSIGSRLVMVVVVDVVVEVVEGGVGSVVVVLELLVEVDAGSMVVEVVLGAG